MKGLCFLLIVLIFSFIFVPADSVYADFEKFLYIKVWCPTENVMNHWTNGSDEALIVAYEKYNRDGKLIGMENQDSKTIWCGHLYRYTCKEEFYMTSSLEEEVGWITYDYNGNITDRFGLISAYPRILWDEHREMLQVNIHIELSTSGDVFHPGDKFDLMLDFENRGFEFSCHVYIAICTPNAEWLFFPGYELQPAQTLSHIIIPSGMKLLIDVYKSVVLPSIDPPINQFGNYEFAIALVEPFTGNLIGNAFDRVQFTYIQRPLLVDY